MDAAALKTVWPFGDLLPVRHADDAPVLVAADQPSQDSMKAEFPALALAPQQAPKQVSPAFAAFDQAAAKERTLDQVTTGAVPVPARLEDVFGNPRTQTGDIPVPVLSERFDAPDVVGFWQVAVPVMPAADPYFPPVKIVEVEAAIPVGATALDYQDW